MCGTIIGGPLSTQLSQQIAFAAGFVKTVNALLCRIVGSRLDGLIHR
jgi:hypothetical protein